MMGAATSRRARIVDPAAARIRSGVWNVSRRGWAGAEAGGQMVEGQRWSGDLEHRAPAMESVIARRTAAATSATAAKLIGF
jgi:hypothetical protein